MLTLEYLAKNFKYKHDGKIDVWKILKEDNMEGDCEEYALTALYILSNYSMLKFWYYILTYQAHIHFVTTKDGEGHAVLRFKHEYIDNWTKKLVSKKDMEAKGHRFSPWSWYFHNPLAVAFKLLIGKFL